MHFSGSLCCPFGKVWNEVYRGFPFSPFSPYFLSLCWHIDDGVQSRTSHASRQPEYTGLSPSRKIFRFIIGGAPWWMSDYLQKKRASTAIQHLTVCTQELTTSTACGCRSIHLLLVLACTFVIYCLQGFLLGLSPWPLDLLFSHGNGAPRWLVSGKAHRTLLQRTLLLCILMCVSILKNPSRPWLLAKHLFPRWVELCVLLFANCVAIGSVLVGLQSEHYWAAKCTFIKGGTCSRCCTQLSCLFLKAIWIR